MKLKLSTQSKQAKLGLERVQGSDSTDENKRLRSGHVRGRTNTLLCLQCGTQAKQILFALYLMGKILGTIFTTRKEI